MLTNLTAIEHDAQAALQGVAKRPDWEAVKGRFLGPQGRFTLALKEMASVPVHEKPARGKALNATKQQLEQLFDQALTAIEEAQLSACLGPALDVTLPTPYSLLTPRHPLSQMKERLVGLFTQLGFTVAAGPEVESDWYCFDALNTPANHPARDAQDTLYPNLQTTFLATSRRGHEPYVLRTHTSAVQIRCLLQSLQRQPTLPLAVVSPGRVFRRDTVDATHTANFHQVEGLYLHTRATVADLKSVLDAVLKRLFGLQLDMRLRPSFFPFTEPSFEVDIRFRSGKLADRWIEVLGCGMVDPAVLEATGHCPHSTTGFAFGMGVERLAMLYYGVDDIRHFYQNDIRFLRQFI
jgi:phenylalanyl-tRNA synthetase alpha chain